MTITMLLLLLVALFVAVTLSWIQYKIFPKNTTKLYLLLTLLRALSWFLVFILLINPKITNTTFENHKPVLPIFIDNSLSISDLKSNEDAVAVFKNLQNNKALNTKYDLHFYRFDSHIQNITTVDDLDFSGKQTHIDKVSKYLQNLYKNKSYPSILISDGNQTHGMDFPFAFENQNPVHTIVLGDTTTVLDLKIGQINANKYAFLKNKFPVEVFLQYTGNKKITGEFLISNAGKNIYKTQVTFNPNERSKKIEVLLPTEAVGLQTFRAFVTSSETEKNTTNNSKNFAVEIIDQQSEVAIISTVNHPDLGAIKRAIASNEQRKVTIIKPSEIKSLDDFSVLVLYQPNSSFANIFELNKSANKNLFIISGLQTDFNFLNKNQTVVSYKMSSQKEEYSASYQSLFNLFTTDNFGFEQFPPLDHPFGTWTVSEQSQNLLQARIRNTVLDQPLLTFSESNNQRVAFLMGENLWKWRLQSHIKEQNFEAFDVFTDKIIQYLTTNNQRKRLNVSFENFYNAGDDIRITAQYFNKNYEFDAQASLTISLTHSETKNVTNFDLLKSGNAYNVNLDALAPGAYNFSIKEKDSGISFKGYFEILAFEIEKQFVGPNYANMSQLAQQTNALVILPNQLDQLINNLLETDQYKTTQKQKTSKTPLIEWYWLLILLAILLATEWFVRKYNGLL